MSDEDRCSFCGSAFVMCKDGISRCARCSYDFDRSMITREVQPASTVPTAPTAQETAASRATEWQPIETAPKGSGEDGPRQTTHPDYIKPPKLLLATAEGVIVGYYDWYYHPGYGVGAEPGESAWRDHDGGRTYGVTHWQPLPPPPRAAADEGMLK